MRYYFLYYKLSVKYQSQQKSRKLDAYNVQCQSPNNYIQGNKCINCFELWNNTRGHENREDHTFVPRHICALTCYSRMVTIMSGHKRVRLCPDTFVPWHLIIVWSQSCLGTNVHVCAQTWLWPYVCALTHVLCSDMLW